MFIHIWGGEVMRIKILAIFSLVFIFLISFSIIASACPVPSLNSVSPNQGTNKGSVNITIEGAKFHKSVEVKLTKSGEPDIVATNIKLVSKNQITCTLDLTGKPAGKWDLIVSNIGSITKKEKVASPPGVFTIVASAPIVSAIIPKMGLKNTVVSVSINGDNFKKGATVALSAPELTEIIGTRVKVISETQITCDLNLNGATPGIYNVKVTNADGQYGKLDNAFAIDSQAPLIKMIIPNRGANDGPVTLTLSGANFDEKASAKLAGSGKEIIGSDTGVASSSDMSVTFDLTQQEAGVYDVIVANPDGKTGILAGGFTIEKIMEEKLLKSLFFNFDKYNIRPDQKQRLNYNLDLLKDFKNSYIILDGHADERGTKEYNVALAGRRAETVKKFLVQNGFDPEKITINAYGEDYPIKKGHNESSWWYNRRVDISIWETNPTTWGHRSQSIFFEKKSAILDKTGLKRIDRSITRFQDCPQSFIILVANTKDYDSDLENSDLAQKRLAAIKDYLMENGVSEDRISAIDNGKVYPFFSDSNDNIIDSRVDLLIIQF
jgi:outer membrane protein OmpA-like peptidoglycan-associated protein